MRNKHIAAGITLAVVIAVGLYAFYSWRKTTDPEYRLRKGQEAIQANDLDEAERYARLLEEDSQTDRALVLKGEILLRRENYAEALRTFNRIQEKGAIRLRAAALSGECLVQLNEPLQAEQVFRFVVAEDPNHIDAHRYLGAIYYDQGDLPRAVAHLQAVGRLDPKDARPHRLIGLIYKDVDQMDQAIEAYSESLFRNPTGDLGRDVRIELAECHIKRGGNDRAIELVEGINWEDAVAIRAEALVNLDRSVEALPLLEDSLERFPRNGDLLRLRAKLFLLDNHSNEAVKLLERAVRIDPGDYRSRYQLALAFERLDRKEEAQKQHQEVKAIQDRLSRLTNLSKEAMGSPWDADVRLRLAKLCDELHKPKLAAMWRSAAAACGPNGLRGMGPES